MIETILLLSVILHISTFVMIYKLTKKINSQNSATPLEISELLDLYLEEIKEENRDLKNDIQKYEETEEQLGGEVKKPKNNITQLPVQQENRQTEELPMYYKEKEDFVEASDESKMLNLYQQGYEADDIAQKLNVGKTEVELFLKFHNKNNDKT